MRSSAKNKHKYNQSSSISAIPFRKDKENEKYTNFLINTVESPEPVTNTHNNILCQELSSFKLDSSLDSVPENTMKNSKLLL